MLGAKLKIKKFFVFSFKNDLLNTCHWSGSIGENSNSNVVLSKHACWVTFAIYSKRREAKNLQCKKIQKIRRRKVK